MSSNRKDRDNNGASSSAACSRPKSAVAQFKTDARLISAYDKSLESGTPFNYSTQVLKEPRAQLEPPHIPAYLNKIQRGGLVQSFGCLLCVDPANFSVLAYSENVHGLLGDVQLGADARSLFQNSCTASLAKAVESKDPSLLNPIWVCSVSTLKHFYAILHRLDVGVIIDFEPAMAHGGDPGPSIVGAVQSQKLATRVISRLQALPRGNVSVLCNAVVQNVRELTGYDRVMVYKFHEDEHGEVVAEVRRPDLEEYLGLHYPATDIPQASRFLYKQNRIRMICDCNAEPVKVIQDMNKLGSPLCLVNSTLRAPHSCHATFMFNMGSIASLVMAITINEKNSSRLWGLLVCHHTSLRYIPFPLRYACEFLIQAFSLQLSMELQLCTQKAEKKILQTQVMLSDMLVRDNTLTSVVTGSPSIMDLVTCNGAALYCRGKFHLLGVTPNESELMDIMQWLLTTQQGSEGLSTDSLLEAGYPGSATLGDKVCGMVCTRINEKDFMFWFRSATSKEVKWGGAKHDPKVQDSDERMHPRISFNAFLEVVKTKSVPWELSEINAIHSLQLIMRGIHEEVSKDTGTNKDKTCPSRPVTLQLEELRSVASEMVKLIDTASVPIIAVNCTGLVNGWNAKVAELTGLSVNEAMMKSLVGELIHEDSREAVDYHLSRALQGFEDKDIELKLQTFGSRKKDKAVFLRANACTSRNFMQHIVGVCFVGQDVTGTKAILDKFVNLQGDYKSIVQSVNSFIPPLFICDENWCCCEWNPAMESLTGWTRQEVLGKILPGEIFGICCRLKDQNALTKFKIILYEANAGQYIQNEYFCFYDRNGKFVEALLMASGRTDSEGKIIGSVCFLQTDTPELPMPFKAPQQNLDNGLTKLKDLVYLKQELRSPFRGIQFSRQVLETSGLSDEQRKLLETSFECEKQIMKIIEGAEVECIEEGTLKLDSCRFTVETVISTITSQVMPLVEKKKLHLLCQIPDELRTVCLYGDQIRLQQVLADFLFNIVQHATSPDGHVQIEVIQSACTKDDTPDSFHLKFRLSHTGSGLPSELLQELFFKEECLTHEALLLKVSVKLLKLMDGDIQYVKESEKSYFLISIDLPLARQHPQLNLFPS